MSADDHNRCDCCGASIANGAPWCPSTEGVLCVPCAPTYAELLAEPTSFVDADLGLLPRSERQALYDAHLAAGGKPGDSMAVAS